MEGRPRYANQAVEKVEEDWAADREIGAGFLLAIQQDKEAEGEKPRENGRVRGASAQCCVKNVRGIAAYPQPHGDGPGPDDPKPHHGQPEGFGGSNGNIPVK